MSEVLELTVKIVEVGEVQQVPGARKDRKQILRLVKEGQPSKQDPRKVGKDQHYEIELWNSGIEKFNVTPDMVGQYAAAEFWVNGEVKHGLGGSRYRAYLVLKSFKVTETIAA